MWTLLDDEHSSPIHQMAAHAQTAFKGSLLQPACTRQALISQPQCWLQMLSSWESPGGSVTCFGQFSGASNPVPQLQRQFTAEIDHNTFIYRHLTLTLANPPFKQLEVTSPFGKIQLSTMLTESHGLENVQVGKRISNQREIGAKNRDTNSLVQTCVVHNCR